MLINVNETDVAIKNGHSKRHWQHWVHNAQDEDKQNKKYNTICVGHHHKRDTHTQKQTNKQKTKTKNTQHHICWTPGLKFLNERQKTFI